MVIAYVSRAQHLLLYSWKYKLSFINSLKYCWSIKSINSSFISWKWEKKYNQLSSVWELCTFLFPTVLKYRTPLKRSHLHLYKNPVLILINRNTAFRYHGTNFSPMQLYYFSHRTFSTPSGLHIICDSVLENKCS